MIRLQSDIDMGEVPEAMNGKTGSGKQSKSQRELPDDGNALQATPSDGGSGTPV